MSPSAPLRASQGSVTAISPRRLLATAVLACAAWLGCGDSQELPGHADAARSDAATDASKAPDLPAGAPTDARRTDAVSDATAGDVPGAGGDGLDAAPARLDAGVDAQAEALDEGIPDAPQDDASLDAGADAAAPALDGGQDEARDSRVEGGASMVDGGREGGGEAGSRRLVAPTLSGTVYTFTAGTTTLAVDSAIGARVVTFAIAGKNILTTPAAGDSSNYGSTFWTSPQSDWSWPPPSQIDPGAYTGAVDAGVLSLTSATASSLAVAVSKEFSMDADTGDVTIRYGIANKGSKARAFAPWEISRVAAGGLTFFPMGDGAPQKGSQDLLKLAVVGGVAWLDYDAKAVTADQKVFADGAEGWIAHVAGDLLLVKAFGDTTPAEAAPSEAEIELFTNAGHTYIEVEEQGAYASIPAKTSPQWTVRWYLRRLDPSVSVAVGSTELLAVVRALVGGG